MSSDNSEKRKSNFQEFKITGNYEVEITEIWRRSPTK